MNNNEFKIGTKVKFNLRRPYTKADIDYGCDSRVDGMTGTIKDLWDINEYCIVTLDKPLIYGDGKKVYEYWDYIYNMEPLTEDSEDSIDVNYRAAWFELKKNINDEYKNLLTLSNNPVLKPQINVFDKILSYMNNYEKNANFSK